MSHSDARRAGQTYFTMWTILKSTLLLSTRIELLADYHIATVTNRDAIAIHQGACLMFSQFSSMPGPNTSVRARLLSLHNYSNDFCTHHGVCTTC